VLDVASVLEASRSIFVAIISAPGRTRAPEQASSASGIHLRLAESSSLHRVRVLPSCCRRSRYHIPLSTKNRRPPKVCNQKKTSHVSCTAYASPTLLLHLYLQSWAREGETSQGRPRNAAALPPKGRLNPKP